MAETLTGEVSRITYESEETSFRVIRVQVPGRGQVTCVGKFQFVATGSSIRLTGDFIQDPKHGEQFKVHTLVPIEPESLAGIEKYLGSGLIPGVGQGFAKRIVETFGLQTLKVLDEQPERLKEVRGLGAKRRSQIGKYWKEQRSLGSLMMLLQTHGVSASLARYIHDKYGERSAEVVQTSPYRLAMDVRGVGFKTSDGIARSMGISTDHPERAQAGVLHVLHQYADAGHVFAFREQLETESAQMLAIDLAHVSAAVDALWAQERVVIEQDAIYLSSLHRVEVGTASHVLRLVAAQNDGAELSGVDAAITAFERSHQMQLAPQQREAVRTAAQSRLCIITGGPGVGKTTIVRAVLSIFKQARISTKLAAPTGRAAKRLTESTGVAASTLHRLLEYDPILRRFQRSEESPLEVSAVIVDEVSMVDLALADSLLSAMPSGARLVLVGDVDQLPSVGPGAVLRDIIDSRAVPVVTLTQIYRQAEESLIVRNAHGILRGELPQSGQRDDPRADFFWIERSDADAAAATILEVVSRRLPRRFGVEASKDVQVLCPMHRGAAGTLNLNQLLQQALNPNGTGLNRGEQRYMVGDRVMQLRNDYEKDVFNGDLGVVVSVDLKELELSVDFDGRVVSYVDSELDSLTLAYATSIHKSQGSEYPAVVIPMLTQHFVMLSRNLLYTAVTRARRACVLVADRRALKLALSELKKEKRNSQLAERLHGV